MLSLRNYLILMFVLVAAVPLALFWAWPHTRAMQNEIEEVQDRHLLIARNLSAALQRYHRDTVATFDYATEAMVRKVGMPPAKALLENLRFQNICLVQISTARVLAAQAGKQGCPGTFPKPLLAALTQLAGERKTVITGVAAGDDGQPVIRLLHKAGDRLVAAAIDTSYFRDLGKSIAFGVKGHAVIVDGMGKVLSHPTTAWEGEMRDISGVSAVRRMLAGEQGVQTFYSPAFKDDMIAGFTSVPDARWGVMVPQPVQELRAKARKAQASGLSIIAMGLLLAALVACRLAVLLARPVERASEAARRVAAGDIDARIEGGSRLVPKELEVLTETFNDMAERVADARTAEAEARHVAEAANESKTRFLRTVTHELRSPLNAIIGFADLLATDRCGPAGSPQYRKCAKDISDGSRHLLSLTNDLLDLARIEAGQYDLVEETVGLDEIAARAVRYVETEAQARGMSVKLVSNDLVPEVRGDERALFQAVLNLTSNAVRYGKSGGEVTVTIERLASGEAEIAVCDDGPGIAPEDLERVLLPFQRVSAAANREVCGSGLGLPIVTQLVRLHGGTVRLTSELGKGTRASIQLPAQRVVVPETSSGGGELRSAA